MSGQHTPGALTVITTGYPRQFRIVSDTSKVSAFEEWDDAYVELCGYCGSYGPHMFAAAPDLLEALDNLLVAITATDQIGDRTLTITGGTAALKWLLEAEDDARAAIAKAEGRS